MYQVKVEEMKPVAEAAHQVMSVDGKSQAVAGTRSLSGGFGNSRH